MRAWRRCSRSSRRRCRSRWTPGPVFGERVVVFGLGAVGLLTSLLLSRAGARVLGVDPRAWRVDVLRDLGWRPSCRRS